MLITVSHQVPVKLIMGLRQILMILTEDLFKILYQENCLLPDYG